MITVLTEVIMSIFIAGYKAAEHPIINIIVGGLWGGIIAKAASVEFIGATKVLQAIKNGNWGGLTIYANQATMQQVGSKVAHGVINGKEKKSKNSSN